MSHQMSKNELISETKVVSESEAEAPSAHSISPVDDELQQIASRARLDREIASQVFLKNILILYPLKVMSLYIAPNRAKTKRTRSSRSSGAGRRV